MKGLFASLLFLVSVPVFSSELKLSADEDIRVERICQDLQDLDLEESANLLGASVGDTFLWKSANCHGFEEASLMKLCKELNTLSVEEAARWIGASERDTFLWKSVNCEYSRSEMTEGE